MTQKAGFVCIAMRRGMAYTGLNGLAERENRFNTSVEEQRSGAKTREGKRVLNSAPVRRKNA